MVAQAQMPAKQKSFAGGGKTNLKIFSGTANPELSREVADYLAVSERTVRRLIAADDLPCLRIGSQIRFDPATLLRWISARKGG